MCPLLNKGYYIYIISVRSKNSTHKASANLYKLYIAQTGQV